MKRLFLVFLLGSIVFLSVNMQGCSVYDMRTLSNAASASEARVVVYSVDDPEAAVEEIYDSNTIMGVEALDETVLEDRFGIAPELYDNCYGKYADGQYGVADLFIFEVADGQDMLLREALEAVKVSRIREFSTYSIYDSLEIAEEAIVYQRGDYMVMIMMQDGELIKTELDKVLPEDG